MLLLSGLFYLGHSFLDLGLLHVFDKLILVLKSFDFLHCHVAALFRPLCVLLLFGLFLRLFFSFPSLFLFSFLLCLPFILSTNRFRDNKSGVCPSCQGVMEPRACVVDYRCVDGVGAAGVIAPKHLAQLRYVTLIRVLTHARKFRFLLHLSLVELGLLVSDMGLLLEDLLLALYLFDLLLKIFLLFHELSFFCQGSSSP